MDSPATPLTRDELLARYGEPERISQDQVANVLALLGKPDLPPGRALAHKYPSVEAFEAYALANRLRNRIGDHGILQVGPAVTDDGVYGALLINDLVPVRSEATGG